MSSFADGGSPEELSFDGLREGVTGYTEAVLQLLAERAVLAREIGRRKLNAGAVQIVDPGREQAVIDAMRERDFSPLSPDDIEQVTRVVMAVCSNVQSRDTGLPLVADGQPVELPQQLA